MFYELGPMEICFSGIYMRQQHSLVFSKMAGSRFFEKIWVLSLEKYDELEGIG